MPGSIKGITIEFRGDVTKLNKALNSVKSETRSTTSELKKINQALKFNPGNTTLLSQKQEVLKDKIAATKDKLDALKRAQSTIDSGAVQVTDREYRNLERDIIQTESKIKSLNGQMSKTKWEGLDASGKKLQEIGGKFASVGKTATKGMTVPIVAGLGAAVKVTADFDANMSKVEAITAKSGDDAKTQQKNMEMLRKRAQEMGKTTKFSASESAEALKYMGMAGWDAKKMYDTLPSVMSLAAASGEDLATTSDIVTDSWSAFGKGAGTAQEYVDLLAKTATTTNTDVAKMGETFKYCAPVAGMMGYKAKDAAVAVGIMANAGIKGSQAGTAMRRGILNLVNPGKQAAEAMDKYGISVTDANGKVKPFNKIVEMFRDKLGGLTKEQRAAALAQIVGTNAASGWANILNVSQKELDATTDAINHSSGAAKNMSDIMINNTKGGATILKSSLEALGIAFGEHIIPYINIVISKVTDLINWFGGLSDGTKKVILIVAGVAAAIGPVITIIGTVITMIGKIKIAIAAIGPLLSGAMGPWGLVAAAAVAAVILIIKNWSKIKPVLQKIWGGIKAVAGVVWNAIKTVIINPVKAIVNGIRNLFGGSSDTIKKIFNGIKTFVGGVWKVISTLIVTPIKMVISIISGIVNGIKSVIHGGFGGLGGFISGVWGGIKGAASIAWGAIGKIVGGAVKLVKGAISKLSGAKQLVSKAWGGIKGLASKVWGGTKKIVSTAANGMKTAFSKGLSIMGKGASKIWGGIKKLAGSAFGGAKKNVDKNTKATTTGTKKSWSTMKNNTTKAWSKAKNTVLQNSKKLKAGAVKAASAVKKSMSGAWTRSKTATANAWNKIKSSITKSMSRAKSSTSSNTKGIKSSLNSIANMKKTIGKAFDDIKKKISISGAANAVKNSASKIKSAAKTVSDAASSIKSSYNKIKNIKGISLPKPKGWSIDPTVKWANYKKGKVSVSLPKIRLNKAGGIFRSATLLGDGNVVGEAQHNSEAVLPLSKLWQQMDKQNAQLIQALVSACAIDYDRLAAAMANVSVSIPGRDFRRAVKAVK